MRFFECVEPRAGLRSCRPIALCLFLDRHEVTDLENHPARFRRVRQLDRVPDAPQAHGLHRRFMRLGSADHTFLQRDLEHLPALLLRHDAYAPTSSASSLPRIRATKDGFLRSIRPAKVARTTLCGLADPSDFVSTL